jgi:hypothetical protein
MVQPAAHVIVIKACPNVTIENWLTLCSITNPLIASETANEDNNDDIRQPVGHPSTEAVSAWKRCR